MMFGTPCEDYIKVNPRSERAMDRIFILHDRPRAERLHFHRAPGADHPGTNPLPPSAWPACGPAHGGANEACLNMLEDIRNGRRRQ